MCKTENIQSSRPENTESSETLKVIICGGRHFDDYKSLEYVCSLVINKAEDPGFCEK